MRVRGRCARSTPARASWSSMASCVALFDLPYDRDGAIALSGHADRAVVREYARPAVLCAQAPPKSTGRELFTPRVHRRVHRALPRRPAARRPTSSRPRPRSRRARSPSSTRGSSTRADRRCGALRRRCEESRAGAMHRRASFRGTREHAAARAASCAVRRSVLRRRSQGSGGLRVARLSASHRSRRERAQRDRCAGAPRAGGAHSCEFSRVEVMSEQSRRDLAQLWCPSSAGPPDAASPKPVRSSSRRSRSASVAFSWWAASRMACARSRRSCSSSRGIRC